MGQDQAIIITLAWLMEIAPDGYPARLSVKEFSTTVHIHSLVQPSAARDGRG
jgi:hypothetical protein